MPISPRTLASRIACALFAGALGSTAAQAQDAPAAAGTTPRPAQATKLEQVTVTAQSRTQEMQDVPIAMNIVTARQVDAVAATDLSHMNTFVPGLVVDNTDETQPTYRLRGIETDDFGIGTDSAVGVYINGIYQTRDGGSLMAFNDIARVEVLKGPQGTLFGRNTAAGAINIITNEPTDKFEGDARVRIGNYGKRYGDALVNIPINQDMALRVSVVDNQDDGWLKDAATGQHYGKNDEWGARIVYRWNITPNTQLHLSYDHDRVKDPSRIDMGLVPMPANNLYARAPFPANPSTFYNPLNAPFYNSATDGREERNYNDYTLAIDHSFSWGSFTSTTNWTSYSMSHIENGTGLQQATEYLNTGVIGAGHTFYQEFKFSGNNDLLDWVAGASYYQEHADETSLARVNTDTYDTLALNTGIGKQYTPTGTIFGYFNSILQSLNLPYNLLGDPWTETVYNTGKFSAIAGYGDTIWHITDKLNFTVGLRFTHDQKDFTWFTPPRSAPQLDATLAQMQAAGLLNLVPVLTGGKVTAQQLLNILTQNQIFTTAVNQLVSKRASWDNKSPRFVLDYKFTPDMMGYVSFAKGYKAGGFDGTEPGSEFAPEKVWNAETGIKTTFPEQNLLVNASAYYYRYNNRQTLTLIPSSEGLNVPQYEVSNTDQAAKGLDLQVEWVPLDNLRLAFNGGYIDSRYTKAKVPIGVLDNGQIDYADVSGQPVDEPKVSYSVNGAYAWHDVVNGSVTLSANYGFRGPLRCNAASVYQGKCSLPTSSFDLNAPQKCTDLRLDWTANGGRWGVALYVNNVFNQRNVIGLGTVSQSVLGTPYAYITAPRMYGAEFHVKF
ncbi:TonB-dependent receptor [Dyella acidiphila]|uniref:TonB-dependent receptor n=1 Tax=Dyella acidiphila TaxID=2775866 RepID=A0ABR9G691_9GAMM|nr:TonB-dependent receptor [Dyella acidiphila]MBE1159558.1 TonB-dependent receptor [Dyella acidiphila]